MVNYCNSTTVPIGKINDLTNYNFKTINMLAFVRNLFKYTSKLLT